MLSDSFNSPSVNRIPYEILRTIIRYAYTLEPPQGEASVLHEPLLMPPLAASHVCCSWRNALVDDPIMWSTLLFPTFKSGGIIEFLRRSKSAPLNVSIKLYENPRRSTSIEPTLISIIFQIHRFKLLHMDININPCSVFYDSNDSRWRIEHLLTCLQSPAPKLETFLFGYHRTLPLESTFPSQIFSGNAPNLKNISYTSFTNINKAMACPQGPVFRNLSKLSLRLPDGGINPNHLLDLLDLSPYLTVLDVHTSLEGNKCLYESLESPDQPERSVSLLHLQSLALKTNRLANLLNFILKHVKIPSNVQWRIASHAAPVFTYNNIGNGELESIHQFLSKSRFTSADITYFLDRRTFYFVLIDDNGKNQFKFLYYSHLHFERHWNAVLVKLIDTSQIARLQLTLSFFWSKNEIQATLRELRHLFGPKSDSVLGHLAPCTVICWDKKLHQRYKIASPWEMKEEEFSFRPRFSDPWGPPYR